INRMNTEIQKVTNLLLGLADHPRSYIHRRMYDDVADTLHVRLDTFDTDACVWEIWWDKKRFHTRCLVKGEDCRTLAQLYISDSQALGVLEDYEYAEPAPWAE